MKKIFYITFLFTVGLLFTGCEKDTSVDIPEPTLKVIESDILFTQTGGSGFIKVESDGAISATSEQSWITLNTSGNTINVSVGANDNIGGRNGIITITSGSEKVEVAVLQLAALFYLENEENNSLVFPPAGTTIKVPYKSDIVPTVSTKDSWVKAVIGEYNVIEVTTSAADVKRSSKVYVTVTFESGLQKTIEINVAQESDYSYLLGAWEFSYSTTYGGSRATPLTVNLIQNVENDSYKIGPFEVTAGKLTDVYFIVKFIPTTKNLMIYGTAQYLGQITGDAFPHAYMCLRSSNNYVIRGDQYELEGVIDISSTTTCKFRDTGSSATYTMAGFGFFNWANQEFTGTVYRQKVFYDIIMTKK